MDGFPPLLDDNPAVDPLDWLETLLEVVPFLADPPPVADWRDEPLVHIDGELLGRLVADREHIEDNYPLVASIQVIIINTPEFAARRVPWVIRGLPYLVAEVREIRSDAYRPPLEPSPMAARLQWSWAELARHRCSFRSGVRPVMVGRRIFCCEWRARKAMAACV